MYLAKPIGIIPDQDGRPPCRNTRVPEAREAMAASPSKQRKPERVSGSTSGDAPSHFIAFRRFSMDISLVICTRDRANQLQSCLQAIAQLASRGTWELIVVDNGSTDRTAQIIADFVSQTAVCVRTIFDPRPGLSRARNAGVAESRGDVIAFTDDDCYPAPDLLDRMLDVFTDKTIGFAGGRILLHDPEDYPLTINESTTIRRFDPRTIVPSGIIQGANIAFRRRALAEIGGFDPELGAGTPFPAEDWDAVTRVCMNGWAGGYFPGPTVSHHHGRKAAQAAEHIRTYNYGSGAVYAKLLMSPRTRWLYGRHWARRMLGDSKYHHRKIAQQLRGALDYWRSAQRGASSAIWP
jgi:hypothetical protein